MDLIYTNADLVDQGVLSAYAFDLSFGASENDFEMTLGASEPVLEFGAFCYIEGTEYGGIVDAMKASTTGTTITYTGRTCHGMLNSKVIAPDPGADYLIVSGDANDILATMVARLGLSGLFTAAETASGINISRYQFNRYCKGYDGFKAMLAANGAKLKTTWKDRAVCLEAVPIVDYTTAPVDGDMASLSVEQHGKKVNHMICLGRGDLAERQVIHLYVDQFGTVTYTQYYTGLDEYTAVYENTNAESLEALEKGGTEELIKLRDADKAEMSVPENTALTYDIGDIVGASDAAKTRISVAAKVTQKIVRINNGAIRTEYKTGG